MIAPFRQIIAWPGALRPAALRRHLPARFRARPPGALLGAHHDTLRKTDDIHAIRGRIDQSTVDHVVLRIPAGNRTLNSALGMRLLRLHAQSRGVVVILETRSRSIRACARDHGLTAVASVRTRELYDGRLRSRRTGIGVLRLPLPVLALIGRMTAAAVLTLGLLTALVLLVPQTTVRIAPELTPTTITVPVEARIPQTDEVLPPGVLPARRFSTLIAHLDSGRSSGIIETADTPARGLVQFRNRTGSLVNLPAGVLVTAPALSSDGSRNFRTRTAITLPAERGATQTVEVEAIVPGPAGNLPAGSLSQVEPGLAGRVGVQNPARLHGGSNRSARTPTVADQDALRATAIARLRERGLEQLRALSVGAFVFHPDSVTVSIQEETFTPPLGGVGATLELTMRASVAVRSTSAAQYQPATGTIRFDMLVHGLVAPVITESQVKAAVQWKSSNDAEHALAQQLPLRAPAQVHITPGLMPRTALFGFRVKVEIDIAVEPLPPRPDASPSLASLPPAR